MKLEHSLAMELSQIHSLCLSVLKKSTKPSLISATLATLRVFLSWMPLTCDFKTNLVAVLLTLFPQAPFRNAALQCITEVCASSLLSRACHSFTLCA